MHYLIFEKESYQIRGAAFEVYREMGSGFLESVYQECLAREFRGKGIPFQEQVGLLIHYKNERLESEFKPDFICWDKIILEIKAVRRISNIHRAQLLNYLVATNLRLGLLINFGHHPGVEIERIVRDHYEPRGWSDDDCDS
ncbi:MAG: GxxExxY protein [Anaerolinea sp.]|nr:GxxExxY protein [Anaerolinea sp.]